MLSEVINLDYRHSKETGVATVEGRPHEAVYRCFEKNYADFLSALFMGKSWGSQLPLTG